jgi:hypothetical protein
MNSPQDGTPARKPAGSTDQDMVPEPAQGKPPPSAIWRGVPGGSACHVRDTPRNNGSGRPGFPGGRARPRRAAGTIEESIVMTAAPARNKTIVLAAARMLLVSREEHIILPPHAARTGLASAAGIAAARADTCDAAG